MIKFLKNKYQLRNALVQYGQYYYDNKYEIRKLLWYYNNIKHKKVAIWGAGLKGTAFLKIIDRDNSRIKYVIDISQKNQGTVLPTGHRIVDYQQIQKDAIDIVFIMNANHFAENYSLLQRAKIHTTLLDMDKILGAKLETKKSIKSEVVI